MTNSEKAPVTSNVMSDETLKFADDDFDAYFAKPKETQALVRELVAEIHRLRGSHETLTCAKFRIGDDVVVTRWHAPAKVKGFIYELEEPFQYPERERDLSPPTLKARSCDSFPEDGQ
jgi:hypothetical protein